MSKIATQSALDRHLESVDMPQEEVTDVDDIAEIAATYGMSTSRASQRLSDELSDQELWLEAFDG